MTREFFHSPRSQVIFDSAVNLAAETGRMALKFAPCRSKHLSQIDCVIPNDAVHSEQKLGITSVAPT
jgi:hypothetical protein